jgi:serine/threonine protein phosphatase 1
MAAAGIRLNQARGPDGMRLYAIGDVHGEDLLLGAMHLAVETDLQQRPVEQARLIHLGDYVDRGPNSRGVLERLAGAKEHDRRVIALSGNHDVGFLDFLAAPTADGLFAHNGGEMTARSYGVDLDFSTRSGLMAGHAALQAAVPERHLGFLRGLAAAVSFGDYFFCHAGVQPGRPLAEQSPDDLMWIRWRFLAHEGLYEKIIVHGHTPTAEVEFRPNRINVDTGAFHTGRLSALVIDGAERRVLTVSEKGQRASVTTP